MGRRTINAINGMGWKFKAALISSFTLLLTLGMYQGWYMMTSSLAAIGTQTAWTTAFNGTGLAANYTGLSINSTAANRLLVVAVTSSLNQAAAQNCSVSYGGQPLTLVNGNGGTSAQAHSYLFYLKESQIAARSTNTLSINCSGSTANSYTFARYAVFSQVDQATPVSTSGVSTNTTATNRTGPLAPTLTITAGSYAIEVINLTRTGSTNARYVTLANNWAVAINGTGSGTNTAYTSTVLSRNIAGNNIAGNFSLSGTALSAKTGMVIVAANLAATLTVSDNYPIASGTKLDTDAGVVMQRVRLTSSGQLSLNSVVLENTGTASTIAAAELYISSVPPQINLPADAVLVGSAANWSGTTTQFNLTGGTAANRTLGGTEPSTKYLYVVYDMAVGQATETVTSRITAVGVDPPSTGASGLNLTSNTVTLTYSGNTMSIIGNTPIAVAAKDSDVNVVMQRFQVNCDPGFDNTILLNSINLEDSGTSPEVSGVKIYISPTGQSTLPGDAKLIGVLNEWNKASTVLELNDDYGTTALDRSVFAGTPKYIYVLYDMYYADIFSPITVRGTVTGVGAASPDFSTSGLSLSSNLITLTRGTWSKITSCGGCHDTQNITDGTARNVPDGKFPGSHYKHTNYLGKNCNSCHQTPGLLQFNHSDGFLNLTGAVAAGYSKGESFPITNEPVMGTCSNISCHSNGLVSNPTYSTPEWGNASTSGCGSCHGADGASPPSSTAHAEHSGSSPGQNSIACVRCHSAIVSATPDSTTRPTIIDRPQHVNNFFNIAFDAFNAGVTYTDASSCANTYCHSSGTTTVSPYGTPKVTSFTWSSSLTCAGCHDTKTTGAVASTLSARHDRHMNPTSNPMIGAGNGLNCVDCHRATITNADNQTIAAGTSHVNKFINYTGLRAGGGNRYNTGTKLCTNIYCHSNGNPGAIVPANPTAWNVSTTYGCNGCHGAGNSLGYPNYGNGGASTATANLHAGHLAGAANTTACADCHRATGDAGTANKFRNYSTLHLNGSPDVVFNKAKASIGPNATVANVGDTVTCSSVICHGSGSPVWGASNASVNTCQKCHGSLTVPFSTFSSAQVAPGGSDGTGRDTAGNTAATAARVGAHQIHLQGQVISGRIRCSECHVNVTSVNQPSHLNYTTATVRFSGRATAGGHNSTAAVRGADGIVTCNNLYCHTTNYNSGTAMAPKWNNTAYISNSLTASDCTRCHAMPPAAITQHNGVAVVNSFPISDGRCSGCHSNLNNDGISFGDIFTNKADHINGVTEANGHVFPYPGASHRADAGTAPWSSCTGCHANTPGGTYPVASGTRPNCTGCHINTLRAPTGTSSCWDCHGLNSTNGMPNDGVAFPNWSGSHRTHVVSRSMACSACHAGGGAGSTSHGHSNRVARTRSTVIVSGSFTYGSAAMTCSNGYCHSTGQSATGGATPVYATPTWSAVANCGSCHLNMDTNGSATGEHVVHAQNNAISCATCHNGYTETTVANVTHANNTIELSFSGTNATGTVYSQGSGPVGNGYGYCSNSYCHSTGQSSTGGATPVYAAPTWGATVTNCGSCHLNMNTNGSATGDHVRHAQTYPITCATCHNGYTETSVAGGTHINKVVELSFSGTASGTVYSQGSGAVGNGFGVCSNSYCHSTGRSTTQYSTTPSWGQATTCLSCHAGRASAQGAIARSTAGFSLSTSHFQHLKYAAADMNCNTCHRKTATDAANLKNYSGVLYHVNGTANVGVTYASYTSYKTGTKKCANTTCHGGSSRNAWSNNGALNNDHTCAHCHGVAGTTPGNTEKRRYAPGWVGGGISTDGRSVANDLRVGAHFAHLSSAYMKPLKCNECHLVPSTPLGGTHIATQRYLSQTLTFAQASTAIRNSTTPVKTDGTASTAATCTTTYCHGSRMPRGDTSGTARSPLWNQDTLMARAPGADCSKCHGNPPSTGSSAASHNGRAATVSCSQCHNTVTSTGAMAIKSQHIDGTVQASGGHSFPYPGASHRTLAGTTPWSSCTGCHANTTGGTYPVTSGNAPNCTGCHINTLRAPTGTSSCWDCHGVSSTNGMPSGGVAFPNWSGSHRTHVVGQAMACSACHDGGGTGSTSHGHSNGVAKTRTTVVVSSPTGAFSYVATSQTCSSLACHGNAVWSVTQIDCVSCHSIEVTITAGSLSGQKRRAVATEFTLTWSHKRSGGRTAGKADCVVCHMEGNPATGGTSILHKNGSIELRDPDTGTTIKGVTFSGTGAGAFSSTAADLTFARFSRNLGIRPESDSNWGVLAAIQINQCLKCHDANGAASTAARVPGGTAMRPFNTTIAGQTIHSNGSGNIVNVDASFNTTNASYHPVKGRGNNSFVKNAKMKGPYTLATDKSGTNTTSWGLLITCWDCHAPLNASGIQTASVTAHGGAVTLRRDIRTAGTATNLNLCIICHATAYATVSNNHGSGSAYSAGGESMSATTTMANCHYCHAYYTSNGTQANGPASSARPTRGEDAHGFNGRIPGQPNTKWVSGSRPYSFIRNSLTNWRPANAPADGLSGSSGACWGSSGTCNSQMGGDTYSPGGTY